MSIYLARWEWRMAAREECWRPPEGVTGRLDLRGLRAKGRAGGTGGWLIGVVDGALAVPDALHLGERLDDVVGNVTRKRILRRLRLPALEGLTVRDVVWELLTSRADPQGMERCAPLLPGKNRFITCYMEGVGVVRQERFSPDAHPWAVACMQQDYLRMQLRDGKKGRAHRKLLGAWCNRYHVPPATFVPPGEPVPEPLPPTTDFHDTFDRNEPLDSAAAWTEVVHNWQVSNGEAILDPWERGMARCEVSMAHGDMEVRAVTVAGGTNHYRESGPITRFASGAATGYVHMLQDHGTGVWDAGIWQVVNNSWTELNAVSISAPSFPAEVMGESDGSTLRTFINGSQVQSMTDSSITGNTHGGMHGFAASSSGTVRYGEFFVTDHEDPVPHVQRRQHAVGSNTGNVSASLSQTPNTGNILVAHLMHADAPGASPTISGSGWTLRYERNTLLGVDPVVEKREALQGGVFAPGWSSAGSWDITYQTGTPESHVTVTIQNNFGGLVLNPGSALSNPYDFVEWDMNPGGVPFTHLSVAQYPDETVSGAYGSTTLDGYQTSIGGGWFRVHVPLSDLNAAGQPLGAIHVQDLIAEEVGHSWDISFFHYNVTDPEEGPNPRRGLAVFTKTAGAGEPTTVTTNWDNEEHLLVVEELFDDLGRPFGVMVDQADNDNGDTQNASSLSTGSTGNLEPGEYAIITTLGMKLRGAATAPGSVSWTNDVFGGLTVDDGGGGRALLLGHGAHDTGGTKSSTGSFSGTENHGLSAGIMVFGSEQEMHAFAHASGVGRAFARGRPVVSVQSNTFTVFPAEPEVIPSLPADAPMMVRVIIEDRAFNRVAEVTHYESVSWRRTLHNGSSFDLVVPGRVWNERERRFERNPLIRYLREGFYVRIQTQVRQEF